MVNSAMTADSYVFGSSDSKSCQIFVKHFQAWSRYVRSDMDATACISDIYTTQLAKDWKFIYTNLSSILIYNSSTKMRYGFKSNRSSGRYPGSCQAGKHQQRYRDTQL